jgi:hypothetical protein
MEPYNPSAASAIYGLAVLSLQLARVLPGTTPLVMRRRACRSIETLAGRYNLASRDLGRVRDQRREILAHVIRGSFRRFFRSRLILKDRD